MNPWIDLPTQPPYVLTDDQVAIGRFNQTAPASTRIETALLPEPFVGRVDAPVVLLTLNPGVSAGDFTLHEQPEFRRCVTQCHRQDAMAFPNYYLDPAVSGPGARWLHRIARPLVSALGAQAVATGLSLMEFFPYHSERFAHARLRVTSQAYTFALVRAAMARGAAIFITRGWGLWYGAVPELRAHPRLFFTRSVQNIVISPNNCPEGYPVVEASLRDAAVSRSV